MPICFTHLKIAGFKSFADSTSLDILPGLTGIVGPNGCGKSNIVEAIRWAMGESSARSLRGGEMDDVIFAGTARRASHNIAEVTLTLENSENIIENQSTPSHTIFQHQNQLQISRQIERGTGSQYRLNGKNQRARDVQTLFADFGSGPRSSTIISQNRISQLISATPEERKQVLEEAAGISGLHNRRREAELKLKATEENLARLDDLKQQLEILTLKLQEQSIQATEYRSLSKSLRENELHLNALYFKRATLHFTACQEKVIIAQQQEIEKNQLLEEIQKNLEALHYTLPALRQQETQARIQWDQKRYHIQNLENEQKQTEQEINQLTERLKETETHHQNTEIHIEKIKQDQHLIQNQLITLDQELTSYPEQKSKLEEEIQSNEKQFTALTTQIKLVETELQTKKNQHQNIIQHYEETKQKKIKTEQEYQELLNYYTLCLEKLPSEETLQKSYALYNHAKQKIEETIKDKELLEKQIQEKKLAINQLHYQRQQAEESHIKLERSIQQKKQQRNTLHHEYKTIQENIQKLQSQTLTEAEQKQLRSDLTKAQQFLVNAQHDVELAMAEHQKAIQQRLEQETSYTQSLQAYENKRNLFNTAQTELQQAQKTLNALAQQKKEIIDHLIPSETLQRKQVEFEEKKQTLEKLKIYIEQQTHTFQTIHDAFEKQLSLFNQHLTDVNHLQAKADGLKQILTDSDSVINTLPTMLDSISIPQEWIPVIAAIFDNTLEAPLSKDSPKGWVSLNEIQSEFPKSVSKLNQFITVPPALQRAFNHIGIVNSHKEGALYFPDLKAGQILATKQGDIWRWDGYHQSSTIQSKSTQRLIQKQNLNAIQEQLNNLHQKTPHIQKETDDLKNKKQNMKEKLITLQEQYKTDESLLQSISQAFFSLKNQSQSIQSQLNSFQPSYQQAQENLIQKEKIFKQAEHEATLPKPDLCSIQSFKKQEQDCKNQVEKSKQALHNYEREHTRLKEQFQNRQHQNEQNNIRLEGLYNKKNQLEQDQKSLDDSLQQEEEQFQHTDTLENLKQQDKEFQEHLKLFNTDLLKLNQSHQNEQDTLNNYQNEYQTLKEHSIQQTSRLETLKPQCNSLKEQLDSISLTYQQAKQEYHNRPEYHHLETNYEALCQKQESYKEQNEKKQLAYHLFLNQNETNFKQKNSLNEQYQTWQHHLEEMMTEQKNAYDKISKLKERIGQLNTYLPIFIQKLDENRLAEKNAAAIYGEMQKKLTIFEKDKNEIQQKLQVAEQQKHKAYENFLKTQAKEEQAKALLDQIKSNLTEEIEAYTANHLELDLTDYAEKQLKKIIIDLSERRESLGAVNLRAELEYQEKQEQLTHIEKEYTELTLAIQQLRESINKLNQQGKSKLNAIFDQVNKHFQDLFTRMFNGGHAYLKLIPHEDPLRSGLEIYVQPPGKKLSTLSLLSGGEQALTALSLVFAIGRCNPVPICILDEVDAPLDDQNVERFCTLLTDMTQQAGTRFLVVTHHQLTMSHMNRLYGVTMQERGISQIISIDLENAVKIQQSQQQKELNLI